MEELVRNARIDEMYLFEQCLIKLCVADVNAFYLLSESVVDRRREWSMGAATAGSALGVSIAAIIAMYLECALLRYSHVPADQYTCTY